MTVKVVNPVSHNGYHMTKWKNCLCVIYFNRWQTIAPRNFRIPGFSYIEMYIIYVCYISDAQMGIYIEFCDTTHMSNVVSFLGVHIHTAISGRTMWTKNMSSRTCRMVARGLVYNKPSLSGILIADICIYQFHRDGSKAFVLLTGHGFMVLPSCDQSRWAACIWQA